MDKEIQKIENIIEVMAQLKELEIQIRSDYNTQGESLALILALISTAVIPDVTLLPNQDNMAVA